MSQGQSYFQLLTPLILLVFAAGFCVLYLIQKSLRQSAWFAAAYLSGAIAFLVSFFRAGLDVAFVSLTSNTAFLLVAALLCKGLAVRYGRPFPLASVVFVFAAMYCGLIWYLFVDDDIYARTLTVNTCAAAAFALGAHAVGAGQNKMIDRIVFGMMVAFAALYFLRPVVLMAFTSAEMTHASYSSSAFAMSLEFASSVCAMAFAVTLFFAQGMDIVAEHAHRSQSDFLSGLLNRRGFEEQAAAFLAAQRRAAIPISLVVFDIDRFKRINDRHGHARGDRVIAGVADALRRRARASDICGRIGGEEFALLLWASDEAGSRLAAEGLRVAIEHAGIGADFGLESVTASFGVATRRDGETLDSLFGRADTALYAAKQAGRNRVRIAGPAGASLRAAAR